MKTVLILLALLFFSNVFFAQTVDNGGFEDWTDGAPNSWTSDSGFEISEENSIVYSGSASAKVNLKTDDQNNADLLQKVSVTEGKVYKFTAFLYHTEGGARARFYFEDGAEGGYSSPGTTNEWQELTDEFTAQTSGEIDIGLKFYDVQDSFDGSEITYVDDFSIEEINTQVFFDDDEATVAEGDGSYDLHVSIKFPSGVNSTTVDVALISGSATDADNYSTQTITFPAGSEEDQIVRIDITDDSEFEGYETLSFELQNVSGGNNTAIVSPSQFQLNIEDNDVADLVINEILADPGNENGDANNDGDIGRNDDEFVEIINTTNSDIDISGWSLWDSEEQRHLFPGSTIVPANEAIVIFGGGEPQNIPGVVQTASSGKLSLGNTTSEELYLKDNSGNVIQFVDFTSAFSDNQSMGRNPDITGDFQRHTEIDGNVFSPGRDNTDGTALPVELMNFNVEVLESGVLLSWETATEVNNYGFDIERKSEEGIWTQIAFLSGHGNSNSPKYYSYNDENLSAKKYYYRIKQIDNDGMYKYYEPLNIEIAAPAEIILKQNTPNPFNPKTEIQFIIPKEADVKLIVINMLGEEVARLIDERLPAGGYRIPFSLSNLSSGIYIYYLSVNGQRFAKKMLAVK